MDFTQGLPTTRSGFDSILTFVDRFSKRPYFVPCHSNITAVNVARLFYNTIFRHHGIPDSIVSDRDPLFTSKFWKELMSILKVRLKMSTANHPQTDGQTEVMNRMIEDYLRIFCNYQQNDWDEHLASAEFAYSSSVFPATGLTLFYMDLGWNPKSPLDLMSAPHYIRVQSVEDHRAALEAIFKDAQAAYLASREQERDRIKTKYIPPTYAVGDQVLLRSSAYKDHYSRQRPSTKLNSRRIGPFKILALVGKNAIRLELPDSMKIYPVVNVSHTTRYEEQPAGICRPVAPPPPPIMGPLGEEYEVESVLQHRRRNRSYEFLVHWKGHPRHDASWEPLSNFEDADGTYHESLLSYLDENDIHDEVVIPQR